MLLLLLSLLFYSRLCDYFCLIFDSSFSSFCCRCLSLLVVIRIYCIRLLPCGHPWRSYVVLRSFRLMFRFDHWYHTYQLLLFPVSSDVFFILFHPVVVPFFFAWCRRLALTAALSACFRRPCGTGLNLKELSFRWFLICSWELSRLPWHFLCFAYELVRRFVSSFVRFFRRSFWTLVTTPWTNGSHRIFLSSDAG